MTKFAIQDFRVAQLKRSVSDGTCPSDEDLSFLPSKAPRSVHYDLMDAGIIDNVLASQKAVADCQWVSEADWVYKAHFDLSDRDIAAECVELQFACIDTFASAFVNGVLIGVFDNAYRQWNFSIPAKIRKARNTLIVHVKGHSQAVYEKSEIAAERFGYDDKMKSVLRDKAVIRRYQRSYNGDYLGVPAPQGIGIMLPVTLVVYPSAHIEDYSFAVTDIVNGTANVELSSNIKCEKAKRLRVEYVLSLRGKEKYRFDCDVINGKANVFSKADNPEIWWPLGSGEQTLYDIRVALLEDKETLDERIGKVGFRMARLNLVKKSGRPDFQFIINGKPVYIRGGNWVPPDILTGFGTDTQCERLLQTAVHAKMNMLRLWGGGMEETERFYSECDRLGIMIWQDAHMHSNPYPDYDEEFISVLCQETKEMLLRMRNHPSFVVFCGGNEQQEGWEAWNWRLNQERFYGAKLLYEALPDLSAKVCPEIPYISNSPYGEVLAQSPVDGDTHTWGNFINATEDPLFVTETCWYDGTISRPESLKEIMGIDPDEYQGFGWHKRYEALTGNTCRFVNQYSEYHKLDSLRDYAQGLEIEQMRADYMALYYLRTRSPSCNGILYWPLNKGGTFMNYGCVDYAGRPLMPYYLVMRLFKDVVVHVYRDVGDIRIVASNIGAPISGKLTATHMTTDGAVLRERSFDVTIPNSVSCTLASLENWYTDVVDRRSECVYVVFQAEVGEPIEDCVYFCPFVEVKIETGITTASLARLDNETWELTLEMDAYAKLVELECDKRVLFSDNYFSLLPNRKKIVKISAQESITEALHVDIRSLDVVETIRIEQNN